ncbi:hypothetical protein CPB84DRAFT_1776068 [Gymnopilus junonius]|uniref:F-box domain-containing protein n=1 Tax=Gymnopilus junonius TaxID=109634 RepID=A0A9P5NPW9_GYMJU|nr:hypothetical protein CPB84DRAFT_1776068 [Gymnopilus junonius]
MSNPHVRNDNRADLTSNYSLWDTEDPLNLMSDYDPAKCAIDDGHPCGKCQELGEIQADIRRAYDLLKISAQKRRGVKGKINQVHDHLIRRLPPELISRIFKTRIESSDDLAQDTIENSGAPIRQLPWLSEVDLSAPLILSAVCRGWRQIAFSTPDLWTTVVIYLKPRDIHPSAQHMLQLTQWLDRSKDLPLDIFILEPSYAFEATYLKLFDVIKAYVDRWQSLTLTSGSKTWRKLLGDGTFTLPKTSVLEHLHLRRLSLSVLPVQLDYYLSNITMVTMEYASVSDFFEVIHHCPKLRKLDVNVMIWDDNPESLRLEFPILHGSLEFLRLCAFEEHFKFLLDHLVLSSLNCIVLSFRSGRDSSFPADKLISFLIRSKCPIQTFELWDLDGLHITDSQLIAILEHL